MTSTKVLVILHSGSCHRRNLAARAAVAAFRHLVTAPDHHESCVDAGLSQPPFSDGQLGAFSGGVSRHRR